MATYNEEQSELQQALKDFAASPRFNFLKSLQVGPLVGDDAGSLGAVAQMTFEELVTSLDSQASVVHTLNDAQQRLLVAVLRALSEGENPEHSEPSFEVAEEVAGESDEEGTPTTFNSVQCELELRERIAQLKGHPSLARIHSKSLGSFWVEGVPRAPFEESLTISQLLSLDVGVLAKKRSMTSARMRSLALALEQALHFLEGGGAVAPQVERNFQESFEPTEPQQRRPFRHRWHGHYASCSPSEMAIIESVMFASSEDAVDADTVFGALHHFCSAFTVNEFLSIMRGGALTIATQRKLSAWAHSGALREVTPLFEILLQGPGAHITKIATLLHGPAQPASVYGIAATLIVRGLGATMVTFKDTTCPDVWTRNPALISLIVGRAQALARSSGAQALSSVCPDMDPFLHQWVQGIAFPQKKGKKRRARR